MKSDRYEIEIAVARRAARETSSGDPAAQGAGRTYDEIALLSGLSRTGVFDICKRRHEERGAKALRDAPGGRQAGQGRVLDLTQEFEASRECRGRWILAVIGDLKYGKRKQGKEAP